MSNIDTDPDEIRCRADDLPVGDVRHPYVEIITSREVPLGGPRAMSVRRTLPQRQRSLIGAWCFVDHYGPDDVVSTGGMDVAPHPHTGLQTVSWLFTGEIEHRDSLGVHAIVRPGEVNLMTGGHGICHSEVSTPGTSTLHGVQLWVALPDAARNTPRDFQHYVPPTTELGGGARARVFLGNLAGSTSPVTTFSPLLGAEIVVEPGATVALDVDPGYEHGLLVDTGSVALSDTPLSRGELGYVGTGVSSLTITGAGAGDAPARLILLGGTPFGEEIVMWWNFVGRDHDEIAAFRDEWERESERFGRVEGYVGAVSRLPAPQLPHARIRPRRNPPTENPQRSTQEETR
ncbi:pirin family protein [Rhodococcus coprophilus]|uniref:pirin family protein n=1 Tax=Rhodococcus coprophilus TaxID=38310 RepID=UPI0033E34A8F